MNGLTTGDSLTIILMVSVKWLLVCGICAAPSFIIAFPNFNVPAMLVGIAVFVVLFTYVNLSQAYRHAAGQRPQLRLALVVGFGLKTFIALLGVMAFSGFKVFGFFSSPDLIMGIAAVGAVGGVARHFHLPNYDFFLTLAATLIEGLLLTLAVIILSAVVWGMLLLIKRARTS